MDNVATIKRSWQDITTLYLVTYSLFQTKSEYEFIGNAVSISCCYKEFSKLTQAINRTYLSTRTFTHLKSLHMVLSDFAGLRYCLRNRGTNFLVFVFSCKRSYTTSHKQFKLDKCSMLLHWVVGYIPIQFITFPIIELSHLSLSKNNQVVLYS